MTSTTQFIILISIIVIIYIPAILFCRSVYKTLSIIPAQHQPVPAWLSWLMLIPIVDIVFIWIILPFAMPNAIKRSFPQNNALQQQAKTLFALGLSIAIIKTLLLLTSFIDAVSITTILWIAALIIWIIYWVKIVAAKELMATLINQETV